MAFLQRIVNGGGRITRESALSRKRVDLLVEWKKQRIIIELKIKRGEDTLSKRLSMPISAAPLNLISLFSISVKNLPGMKRYRMSL